MKTFLKRFGFHLKDFSIYKLLSILYIIIGSFCVYTCFSISLPFGIIFNILFGVMGLLLLYCGFQLTTITIK